MAAPQNLPDLSLPMCDAESLTGLVWLARQHFDICQCMQPHWLYRDQKHKFIIVLVNSVYSIDCRYTVDKFNVQKWFVAILGSDQTLLYCSTKLPVRVGLI